MSSRRGSTRTAPRLPSEDDDNDYEDAKRGDYSDSYSGDYDEDDEEEENDGEDEEKVDSAPTLGRACIYGPGDEVVYRPAGSWCRGDDPAQFPQHQQKPKEMSSGSPRTIRRTPPAAPSAVHGYPEVRRKKKVKRLTSAGCLYGKDGEVLYAPETSDCVNGIGAPQRP